MSTLTVAAAKRDGKPSGAGRFLRIADVVATTGISRPTIYRLLAREEFPRQHTLTTRCVGWWESDVAGWLRDRRGGAPG